MEDIKTETTVSFYMNTCIECGSAFCTADSNAKVCEECVLTNCEVEVTLEL